MRSNFSKIRLAVSASVLSVATAVLPGQAEAASCVWSGGVGSWSPAGGWSGCAVPAPADDAVITSAGSVVSIAGINANAATLNLGLGNALNITNSNMFLGGGTITNNGVVTLGGAAGAASFINTGAPISIGGNGVFLLNDSLGAARIYGGQWTFGSGQILRGSGQLGINQAIVTNNGLFSANVSGGNLSIDVSGGSGGLGVGSGVGVNTDAGLYNTGIMEATNGGVLSFESGRYENSALGVIRAVGAGSIVSLNGDSRIVGGTLSSSGGGVIQAFNSNQYLNNVTLASGSNLNVRNNNLFLNTSFTNNGTVTLGGSAGAASIINESANLTITGAGTIVLDDSLGVARIYGNAITFGSNQSIRGSGQLGINQAVITNNGLFSANTGSNLSIDVSGGSGGMGGAGVGTGNNSGLLNNNVMEATGGSSISFESGRYENALGATIRATGNSVINLNGDARIVGGTLSSDASSRINAINTNQFLNDVTLAAGSNLLVRNDNLYLNTSFTNNGTVTLGGVAGAASIINETGSLAINGTGTIVLDDSAGVARIYGGNITFGAGQTVQGAGQLGINQTTFTINNVFSANSGSNLSIDVSGGSGGMGGSGVGTGGNAGLFNTSTIQATGGSSLSFEGGRYENSALGVVRAVGAGSIVSLNGDARIVGGTLASSGGGVIQAFNTTQYLNDVTLASGSNLLVRNDNLVLNTSFTNNGTVTLGGVPGAASIINETANLTITGSGTIVLDDSLGVARIYGNAITFGSNQSIRGSGQLGVNQTVITNNGLFSANTGSNLSIDVSGGSGGLGGSGVGTSANAGLLNNSVMEATGSSSISFESGRYENAPGATIRAMGNSIINLNGDARIVGGTLSSDASSRINAINTTQYLNDVTLAAGSNLVVRNDNLVLNNSFTNNGTVTLGGAAGAASIINETGTLAINGTGTIVLDNSAGLARIYSGNITFGASQTVRGSGQIGVNQAIVSNAGLISADAGSGISIDVSGGSGGLGGGGVGPGGNNGLFNTGTIQANGRALDLESGRYANDASGTLAALSGGTFTMNGDANLINLQAGNVLNLGSFNAIGAGSTLNLRGTGANIISTIGTGAPGVGTDTVVTLSGVNSALNVTNFSTNVNTAIDNSLFVIAGSGQLNLTDGRDMTITANSGNFINNGLVQLGGSAFSAAGINNLGTIRAISGVNSITPVTGTTGTIETLGGSTLNVGGSSATGFLTNNGALGLGANNITVTSDYTNANFGSGNAFNAHANVSGSGLILAADATMDLSSGALTGSTLNLGNLRTGGATSATLTITNNGLATNLIGAVQNTGAPGVSIASPDWTAAAGGGSANVTINFAGAAAGSLAGQTLNVVNNFDNVANRALNLQGAVYQIANPVITNASDFINIGPVLVGSVVTRTLNISNAQVSGATGFQEGLNVSWGAATGNSVAGVTGSLTNLAAGASNSSALVLTFDTSTAGAKVGAIDVLLATNGAGTSGLGLLSLPTQNLAVTGTVNTGVIVLNPAVATILTSQPITVGAQRIGGSNTASIAIRNDGAPPSAGLDGSFASATGAVTGSGSFTNLAMGNTSSAISVGVDTSVAGVRTGTATLNFASNLGPNPNVALPGQTVNVTGNVYEAASANLATNTVNFGPVRQGSASPTGSVAVTNGASGALTDSLVTTVGSLPAGVSGTAPGSLAAGQTGNANFALSTAVAGVVSGAGTLNFASHNPEMADLTLASQSVNFSGIVTQLASAALSQASGAGSFSGSGNAYVLNFGTLAANSGIFSGDLAVTNAIPLSAFSEALGGSFAGGTGNGFLFGGGSFAGLAGGQSILGNLYSFDTTGMAAGSYTQTITFNGFSSFAGLSDFNLDPITISLRATIAPSGGGGAVPEPATWLTMIMGFGLIGGTMRRKDRGMKRPMAA